MNDKPTLNRTCKFTGGCEASRALKVDQDSVEGRYCCSTLSKSWVVKYLVVVAERIVFTFERTGRVASAALTCHMVHPNRMVCTVCRWCAWIDNSGAEPDKVDAILCVAVERTVHSR